MAERTDDEAGSERTRLLQQLHDGPLQLIAVAQQELAEAPPSDEVRRARDLLGEATSELRDLLGRAGRTFAPDVAEEVLSRWCRLVLDPRREADVRIGAEVHLVDHLTFEAARELVSNAAKHSGCTRLWVRIDACDDGLRLEVTDDGRGMDPVWTPGFGLTALRGRVAAAGGTVDHRPAQPTGTRAVVRVPLRRGAPRPAGTGPAG